MNSRIEYIDVLRIVANRFVVCFYGSVIGAHVDFERKTPLNLAVFGVVPVVICLSFVFLATSIGTEAFGRIGVAVLCGAVLSMNPILACVLLWQLLTCREAAGRSGKVDVCRGE